MVTGKNLPEKIPLNAVEREPVETRVLNPNASELAYWGKLFQLGRALDMGLIMCSI